MDEHEKVIQKLNGNIKRIKLINLVTVLVSFVLFIVFTVLRESTKAVTNIGQGLFGYQTVDYNTAYTVLAAIFFGIYCMSFIALFLNMIFLRVKTAEVDGNLITVYIGLLAPIMYINGKDCERCGYYLEGKLKDGSVATVSFSRNRLYGHITFSNGNPPIDI